MTYENIKSVILVILVITSVLLTWSLWTYQPALEMLEKTNTVEEVAIGQKKEIKKIIQPDKIYYHHKKEKHYGTIDSKEIEKTVKEISKWNFDKFENISDEIKNLPSFVHEEGNAVIVFPDSVPIELYKNVIQINDNDFPDFQFDGIVINVNDIQKDEELVYFISFKNQQTYRSSVPASFVQNFRNKYFLASEFNQNFSEYFSYEVSNKRTLFLPLNKTKMARYQYISTPLESEKFKNALFSDPSVVQKNYQTSMEEYTNSLSLLRENFDKNTISYINLADGNENEFVSKDLLKKSIDFVNEHGGWTDNYRFAEIDEVNHKVVFRLYDSKGYPVFSEERKISAIRQVWGQNEINEYYRSNFSLSTPFEVKEIFLSSGQKVIQYLESQEGFDRGKLQDVTIGYKMIKEPQTRLVHLEPSWYYRYNNEWRNISMDKSGGGKHGLE